MEHALSYLTVLPSTRQQVSTFVEKAVAEVDAGYANPLQIRVQMKAISDACDKIIERTKDAQLTEAMKHGGKAFEAYGARVEITEQGTKYDFTVCGDQEWEQIDADIAALQQKKKDREAFLKSLKPDIEVFGSDGTRLTPPVKRSTTGLMIKLL